jgi:hypothetical protein
MEIEMGKMMHGFNEAMRECQLTVKVHHKL